LDHGTALIDWVAATGDQTIPLHAVQHARQAGPKDEGFARHSTRFHRAVFTEHSQYAPLLVAQCMFAKGRSRVRHHRFSRLQQQAWQVAVLKRRGSIGGSGCWHII
jgi:transposase